MVEPGVLAIDVWRRRFQPAGELHGRLRRASGSAIATSTTPASTRTRRCASSHPPFFGLTCAGRARSTTIGSWLG